MSHQEENRKRLLEILSKRKTSSKRLDKIHAIAEKRFKQVTRQVDIEADEEREVQRTQSRMSKLKQRMKQKNIKPPRNRKIK